MSSKIDFLEKLLGKSKYSHNTKEAEFYCCFCFHHKKKLSVNVETDNFKCWVCGKAGKNLVFLIKKVGTSSDVKRYLEHFKAKGVHVRESAQKEEEFHLSLPEEFVALVNCRDKLYAKRAISYLNNRGVTDDDILFYKMGIANSGKYQDRIILPSFNKDGNLNFFTARVIGSGTPPYLDADVPKGYKKEIIINELYIDWSKSVTMVEGFFDMLKAENAVPIFGSLLGRDQKVFQEIVKHGNPVYLAGDADAVKKFQKIGELFMNYDIDAYFIDVTPFKDVGEMAREEFLQRKENASLLTRNTIFKSRLQSLCQ